MKHYYPPKYFANRQDSYKSAQVVVPIVLKLMDGNVRSVLDIGCGDGCWLRAFQKCGIVDVHGVDGTLCPQLMIPEERFTRADLSKPFIMERVYDLVVSLELAEHLPPESAETFVESLCKLAPVILFSAAIPFQGGIGHQNEQWPEYWAAVFLKRGFQVADPIRRQIWNNTDVNFFYRQNILIFFREKGRFQEADPANLLLIHPELFLPMARLHQKLGKMAPKWVKNIGKRFLKIKY